MDDVRLQASGLFLEPNELTAPPGALREALNVRIRRPNIIEPRPGFPLTSVTGASGGGWQVFSWQGEVYGVFGGKLWLYDAVTPVEVKHGATSLVISSDEAFAEPMGRVFLVVTDNGIYRIPTPGSTSAVPAGVPAAKPPMATSVTGTGVANNEHVAMRVLFSVEVNDQLLVGAPSAPVTLTNTSGGAVGVQLEVPLPDNVTAGMTLQVYRTEIVATSVPTGDEMALAASYVITSADVTAGYATVSLMVNGAGTLGASLYTNETQEGILQAAYPPPNAACLAWWKGMGFYGDIRDLTYELRGFSVTLNAINPGGLDVIDSGSATNGSPTITGLSDGTAFTVGMYLSKDGDVGNADSVFPAFSRVISNTATTVTFDKNALSSAATVVNGHGVFEVGGVEFINGAVSDLAAKQFGSRQDLVELVALHTSVLLTISDYDADAYEVVFSSPSAFDVEYTGAAGTTKLFGLYGSPATSAEQGAETHPARIMWSRTLQPEAVPLLQFQDIGDYRAPVMRLIPTRDSLFVLKADGVWRVTGDGPDTLRVEEFDRSIRLIHRRAADAFDNQVWAWTSTGIVALSEAGVQRMSEPSIASAIDASQDNIITLGLSTPPGGCFITGCTTQECVLVGVPADDASGAASAVAGYVYVYEAKTSAWTRWQAITNVDWRGAVEHAGEIVIVGEGAALMFQDADATDFTTAVTVTGATSTQATIATLGSGGVGYRIVQGLSRGSWLTEALGSAAYTTTAPLEDGAADASAPMECVVEWVAAPTSGALVHWRQMRAQYSQMEGTWRVTYSWTSERVQTAGEVYVTPDDPTEDAGVLAHRMYVTRAHSRCARLRPKLTIESAGQAWRLEGITLTFEPMRGGERMP